MQSSVLGSAVQVQPQEASRPSPSGNHAGSAASR